MGLCGPPLTAGRTLAKCKETVLAADNARLIRQSWRINAHDWITAVRNGEIESRRVVTDEAIVKAVLALEPDRVLDVGCGEGWLCRELATAGVKAVGVDAVPELIAAAQRSGGGEFHVIGYEKLAGLRPVIGSFPLVVCNFSLFDEDLIPLLHCLKGYLRPGGRLLIQTLHPRADAAGDYRDGWRVESFSGFKGCFTRSMPWYFRTLESWSALMADSGFDVDRVRKPADSNSGKPLSLLLQCKVSTS